MTAAVTGGMGGARMGVLHKFGEIYRKWTRDATPPDICEVCGTELEIDAESGEKRCPVCEDTGQGDTGGGPQSG